MRLRIIICTPFSFHIENSKSHMPTKSNVKTKKRRRKYSLSLWQFINISSLRVGFRLPKFALIKVHTTFYYQWIETMWMLRLQIILCETCQLSIDVSARLTRKKWKSRENKWVWRGKERASERSFEQMQK